MDSSEATCVSASLHFQAWPDHADWVIKYVLFVLCLKDKGASLISRLIPEKPQVSTTTTTATQRIQGQGLDSLMAAVKKLCLLQPVLTLHVWAQQRWKNTWKWCNTWKTVWQATGRNCSVSSYSWTTPAMIHSAPQRLTRNLSLYSHCRIRPASAHTYLATHPHVKNCSQNLVGGEGRRWIFSRATIMAIIAAIRIGSCRNPTLDASIHFLFLRRQNTFSMRILARYSGFNLTTAAWI